MINSKKQNSIGAKLKLIVGNLFLTVYCIMAYSNVSYAVNDSIYVTGTKKLLTDALTAFQVILGIGSAVVYVWWEMQKKTCEDNEETTLNKKQKGLFIGVVIAETILTFFNLIGSYYGINFS